MRTTVPRFCGNCRRGPSVGSAGCDAIGAGVALVRQISVETLSASRGLVWMKGDGPSEITTALPRASWPVTTRRIVLGILILPHECLTLNHTSFPRKRGFSGLLDA